jgi:hypothetical protein
MIYMIAHAPALLGDTNPPTPSRPPQSELRPLMGYVDEGDATQFQQSPPRWIIAASDLVQGGTDTRDDGAFAFAFAFAFAAGSSVATCESPRADVRGGVHEIVEGDIE